MSDEAAPPPSPLQSYLAESESAMASLWFLLPFVVLYEVGTRYFTFDPATQTEQRIVAFTLLRNGFTSLGATAAWVAPASVISVLLGQALFRRERWGTRPATVLGMGCESVLLALPLVLLCYAVSRLMGLAAGGDGAGVVLSVGAGIYEELVFRLLGFAVLSFVLTDFLDIRAKFALPGMILTSAVAFSLYHYLGPEPFAAQSFVFRTLAGIYFGVVMSGRGFGVTAGCHAAYDLIICGLRALPHEGP